MSCVLDTDQQELVKNSKMKSGEEEFKARSYQLELFQKAVEENTIICLKTGAGKTHIAVMVIKEYQHEVLKSYDDGRRTIFLVPKVPLVIQQANAIANHTVLNVGHYYGAMGVDFWDKTQWRNELEKHHVLVMTAQILLNMLNAGYMPLSKINLIVFDECHLAVGKYPYCGIMARYQDFDVKPRILGLTASILSGKCKPHEIVDCMETLEKTMHCRIQTSRDMVTVHTYSTKPKEVIIVCNDSDQMPILPMEMKLRNLLDSCGNIINSVVEEEKKEKQDAFGVAARNKTRCGLSPITIWEDSDEEDGGVCNGIDGLSLDSSPSSILKKIYIVLEQLGVKCAALIIERYIADLPKFRRNAEDRLKFRHSVLYDIIENTLLEANRMFAGCRKFLDMVTPKVKRLMELLVTLRPASADAFLDSFRCILFVQCRVTAWILAEFLAEIAEVEPIEYGFIKPCYVVGHGVNFPFLKRSNMSVSKQNEVLDSFRAGVTNLMVATKVVEEGLDIPKCNLVVRFDPPLEFCSYVQSMGRARAEKALYVLLVAATDFAAVRSDVCGYKVIESILHQRCDNRTVPSLGQTFDFHAKQHKLPPFYPTNQEGACLTMNSALSILNMYLNRLPCDRYTVLVPHILNKNMPNNEISCTITMPVGCPLREAIIGDPMSNKDDAKRAAGYQACKLLYEAGELNENLLPSVNVYEKYVYQLGIAPEEEVPMEAPMPGTNRRRLIYARHTAADLQNVYPKVGQRSALHLILARKAAAVEGDGDTHFTWNCCFGILSLTPITNVCPFSLYEKSKYDIRLEQEHNFNSDQLFDDQLFSRLETYHQVVFRVILRLVGLCMMFRPQDAELSFLVVPVRKSVASNSFEIDWDSVYRSELLMQQKFENRRVLPPPVGSVVRPLYGGEDIRCKRYVVRNILKTMTPLTIMQFPETTPPMTYKSYVESKYAVCVLNATQPMLKVCYAPNSMNLLLPSKAAASTPRNMLELIPELVCPLPLLEEAFQHAFFLPSVLHRLNGLLLAMQLTKKIINEARIANSFKWSIAGSDTLEHISSCVTLDDATIFHSANEVPDQIDANKLNALVFQALTTSSAAGWDDMERLELIGDSFLKFVVSVFLYCKFDQVNEGCLSFLRTKLVKNSNLSYHAKAKNIPGILNAVRLQARTNWLPPGYVIPQTLVDQLINGRIPTHLWPFADERPPLMSADEWRETMHARWMATDFSKRDAAQQLIFDFARMDRSDDLGSMEESAQEFTYNHYKQQLISDKTVADSVEALIGAMLASCGQTAALHLVNWFGLRLDTKECPVEEDDAEHELLFHWCPLRKTALLKEIPENVAQKIYGGLDILERKIGYTFKDISFLREAVVHPSFTEHPVTGNYQKLEFLGDAILDYLVTMNLFKANPQMSPGDMTDLRSSLVDNATFAFLTVKYDLHKHLRHRSATLHQAIDKYIAHHAKLRDPKDAVYLVGENEVLELSDVEVPKALGDVFESIAGAVYVDSGYSLEIVWKVFFPIMKELIEMYSNSLPINPVRKLCEHDPNIKFDLAIKVDDTFFVKLRCNGKCYVGSGRTKTVAKQAVAKCALRDLKLLSHRQLIVN